MLFILIGWDELSESEGGDLMDLVEGRLLPGSTVLITSRVDAITSLTASSLNRVYAVTGLTLDSTKELVARYCATMGKPDFSEKVRHRSVIDYSRY